MARRPGRAVRTPSLVLRASPYSESSLVATLLTRDMGRVSVLARGIRKKRPGEAGALDLLTLGHSTIRRRRGELHLLDHSAPFQQWWHLRQRLERIHAAFYVIELARYLGPDEMPQPALFRLFVQAARALDRAPVIRPLVDYYALRALALSGRLPRLDRCACGRPAASLETPRFDAVSGGVLCRACRARRPPIQLTRGTLAAAAYLLRCDRPPSRLVLDVAQAHELGKLLANMTRHAFERPMRTEGLLLRGAPHADGPDLARDLGLRLAAEPAPVPV